MILGWLVGALVICSHKNKSLGNILLIKIWTSNEYIILFVLLLKDFRLDLHGLEICFVLFRTILVNLWSIYPAPDRIYLLCSDPFHRYLFTFQREKVLGQPKKIVQMLARESCDSLANHLYFDSFLYILKSSSSGPFKGNWIRRKIN